MKNYTINRMNKIKNINEAEYIIETISKAKFNKLSASGKRITVAKDVIDRVKFGQIIPKKGDFMGDYSAIVNGKKCNDIVEESPLKNASMECHACGKGGLFLSYLGITEEVNLSYFNTFISAKLNSDAMIMLSKIFSLKQLTLIETAFEGRSFTWNVTLKNSEISTCFQFKKKYYLEKDRLIAICKNIIKNNGTFKP